MKTALLSLRSLLALLSGLLGAGALWAAPNQWNTSGGPMATGLGNSVISAMTVSPDSQTIYAGTGSGTVFSYLIGNYTITADANPPAGGTVSCTPNPVGHGASSTCTATPNAGYTFANWSGDCTGATCALSNVTAAKSVTANFSAVSYAITTAATPPVGGSASCTPNPVGHGGTAVCTATPNAGYTFTNWSGDCTGASCTLANVTAAQSVTANFTLLGTKTYTGPSATGSGNITASVSGGGVACGYTVSRFIAVSAVPTPPPTGVNFPHGLFDFTTGGCTPGETITMTITYPEALPAGTTYWKYGPTPTDGSYHWYQLPATIAGNTATFSITDGGLGDDDLTANGTIVDQGGPGAGGAASIPTLGEWAMLALIGLLALLGMSAARRRTGL